MKWDQKLNINVACCKDIEGFFVGITDFFHLAFPKVHQDLEQSEQTLIKTS